MVRRKGDGEAGVGRILDRAPAVAVKDLEERVHLGLGNVLVAEGDHGLTEFLLRDLAVPVHVPRAEQIHHARRLRRESVPQLRGHRRRILGRLRVDLSKGGTRRASGGGVRTLAPLGRS